MKKLESFKIIDFQRNNKIIIIAKSILITQWLISLVDTRHPHPTSMQLAPWPVLYNSASSARFNNFSRLIEDRFRLKIYVNFLNKLIPL